MSDTPVTNNETPDAEKKKTHFLSRLLNNPWVGYPLAAAVLGSALCGAIWGIANGYRSVQQSYFPDRDYPKKVKQHQLAIAKLRADSTKSPYHVNLSVSQEGIVQHDTVYYKDLIAQQKDQITTLKEKHEKEQSPPYGGTVGMLFLAAMVGTMFLRPPKNTKPAADLPQPSA